MKDKETPKASDVIRDEKKPHSLDYIVDSITKGLRECLDNEKEEESNEGE